MKRLVHLNPKSSTQIKVGEFIRKRITTREFSSKKVKDDEINCILEAGRLAPSSLNVQPWQFIVIKNKQTIKEVHTCSYYHTTKKIPPVMIAIILDKNKRPTLKMDQDFEKRFLPHLQYINIGLPAITMAYQATILGIDSGIKSPVSRIVDKLLRLPKGMECSLVVNIGYKAKQSKKYKREREPLKKLVHYEVF